MPLITFTRGSLSASRQVAEAVVRELGCDIVTREEVIDHARSYGVEETGMADKDFMEKGPPQIWDRHAAQRRLYLIYLRAALMDYMVKGNILYLGHLCQFILADVPRLFRVRIDASITFRVRSVQQQLKLSEAQAKEHIVRIDEKRRKWAKFLYEVDYDSPSHYDMVVNLERMSLETAAAVVAAAVKRPEWQLDDDAKRTVKDIHLSSIVTARLAAAARTRGMDLDVYCDSKSGRAKVRGMSPLVGGTTWENDIKDVVLAVDGVGSVKIIDLR